MLLLCVEKRWSLWYFQGVVVIIYAVLEELMTTLKRSLLMLLGLAAAYILAALVAVYDPGVFLLRSLSNIVFISYSLALLVFFADHIVDRSIRRCLVGVAGLITFWVVLRSAKYIAFEETQIVARHIWYMYYVPALMIPLTSLAAALSVGKQNGKLSGHKIWAVVCVTLVLILLVLTNDLHQLVFRFQPGFDGWDAVYSHGPVFYMVYGWIAILFIATICILFFKCRVSASRRLVWIPMLPALFGVIYLTAYAAGVWPRLNGVLFGQFPESVCFTIAGIWLSLVYIGLIPSNSRYGRLFAISDLSAQIADGNYRVIYRSQDAAELSIQELSADTEVSLDENTRIHRKEVHGGFVYWQDDITELNRINGVGKEQLDFLCNIKSKNELIADLVALLQSPAKNVVSALQSGGSTIHGVLTTLGERAE